MRKIYILPNLFTAGSLFAGMLAIFHIFRNELQPACWLILLSAVLDVADGAIARLTKTTSSFGLHLDSLADLVAFGVAPALLAYQAFDHAFGEAIPRMKIASAVCSLFVVCGALRLARFNVQSIRQERKSFLGLPIPAAALGVTTMIWVLAINVDFGDETMLKRFAPAAMVVLAFLMVSTVPYGSFKQINLSDRQPFEILVSFVFVALMLYMFKHDLDIVMALGSWAYILATLFIYLFKRIRNVHHKEMRPASPTKLFPPPPGE